MKTLRIKEVEDDSVEMIPRERLVKITKTKLIKGADIRNDTHVFEIDEDSTLWMNRTSIDNSLGYVYNCIALSTEYDYVLGKNYEGHTVLVPLRKLS